MAIPPTNRDGLIAAIERFDREFRGTEGWTDWENNGNYEHALLFQNRRYPPKQIISLATGAPKSEFSGGPEATSYLERYGFEVVPLRSESVNVAAPPAMSLHDTFEQILREYPQVRESAAYNSGHYMYQLFPKLAQTIGALPLIASNTHLHTAGSVGQGNWARVPWVAILDDRETSSIQSGVYIVYLFREDGSGVYATLNQGVTQVRQEFGGREGEKRLRDRARALRPLIADALPGFSLDDRIDLRATSGLGRSYEPSTIAYRLYAKGSVPDDDAIIPDLQSLLAAYTRSIQRKAEPSRTVDLGEAGTAFAAALKAAHVNFGEHHDRLVRSFLASTLTKPLVILTGLSGSGKTQIAMKFGEWVGADRSVVIPVRPDWTGPDALFGYEDVLKPYVGGRATWSVPTALEFMLTASRDPEHLYVLLLDEMNLAHVERYFADFLSGMESGQDVLPNLIQDEHGWRLADQDRPRLPIPRNVVVIGTVNVDETTYMFSPKVLDRANTIEFRVATTDLPAVPAKPSPIPPAADNVIASLLKAVNDDGIHTRVDTRPPDEFLSRLRHLHAILTIHDAEFGFRTLYDATRFAALYGGLGRTDWREALDLQVYQKVLPRLHGSRRRLEPILQAIGKFCVDLSALDGDSFDVIAESSVEPVLPLSFSKVRRMMRNVRANQFASFTD